ncbi:unnamed protein product [Cylicostephanus goldi]|uniref:ABC transporter domain-containing protein n=1 Tax=Cylicostephanus goldi TaxID=71465 RepID=A0A3P7NFM3_CYLGO|nr:unnamed protein product [Cylicostephanus goldi]
MLLQEAIYKNLDGKSVILIAHRLSTVEKADKIIVINKGKVEQIGTHDELLRQPGTYATLVARQMMGDQRPHHPQLLSPSESKPVSVIGSHHGGMSLLSTSFTHSASSVTSR